MQRSFKDDDAIIISIDTQKIKSIFEQYNSKLLKKKSKLVERIKFKHLLINKTLFNIFDRIEKSFEQLYDKSKKLNARLKTIAKNVKKIAKLQHFNVQIKNAVLNQIVTFSDQLIKLLLKV